MICSLQIVPRISTFYGSAGLYRPGVAVPATLEASSIAEHVYGIYALSRVP
jgi:hypothetical protein